MKSLGKTSQALIPYTAACINGAPVLVDESLLTEEFDQPACETFWSGRR